MTKFNYQTSKNQSGFKRLYRLIWWVAPVFIRRYLRKRAVLSPQYLQHWDERFGQPYSHPVENAIWIHAVSVGEIKAAMPIIQLLQQQYPHIALLITQMTPTGRATAQNLFPNAQCRYLPYDKPTYIKQFLTEHQPKMGIFMETEIWPNLIDACVANKIPLYLVNARLSPKSLSSYLKIKKLIQPSIQSFNLICAQSQADAERFKQLGASKIALTGNSKYDIVPNRDMHQLAQQFKQWIGDRPVVVCGSTRQYKEQNEEQLLLEAWQHYQGNALLVIIPRHPERFQSVYDGATSLGYGVQKRSNNQMIAHDTQLWIGDSMGELFAYYLAADIVFVGGSLVDTGCQNIIEPIACQKPTIFGYSTFNFATVCEEAQKFGSAVQVNNAQQWLDKVRDLLEQRDERELMSSKSLTFIQQHQGASQRIVDLITQ